MNQRRIQPGQVVALNVGDILMFGSEEETWTLCDDTYPEPCAVLLGHDERSWGEESLLLIPLEAPEANVYWEDGAWQLEQEESVRNVRSGDLVHLASGSWNLLLPDEGSHQSTVVSDDEIDLDRAELLFRVSADEERVVATFLQQSKVRELPSRACLYTLVTLARVRLDPKLSNNADGWISSQALATMLKVTPEKLNLDVHRIRQLARNARVRNPSNLVQRHANTQELRIGVARPRVERL